MERLCKYITRPPVAQDRLERRADGKLELKFKKPWRDGTRALVLEPDDLIARLVAAVPPPRFHTLRYFGVLSSHSSRRALVVPSAPPDPTSTKPPPAPGDQLELLDQLGERDDKPSTRKRWAWLLAHIFAADVETCPRCAGPMRWAEVATSHGGHHAAARRPRARAAGAAVTTATTPRAGAVELGAAGNVS